MAITLNRIVRNATVAPERVLAYMLAFENSVEWDAGTTSCTRVEGDGGVGTRYQNVSEFKGRPMELEYTVESVGKDRFVIVGRTSRVESYDTVIVRPWADGGTELEYDARFTFSGTLRLAEPFLKGTFTRLGDATAADIASALERL